MLSASNEDCVKVVTLLIVLLNFNINNIIRINNIINNIKVLLIILFLDTYNSITMIYSLRDPFELGWLAAFALSLHLRNSPTSSPRSYHTYLPKANMSGIRSRWL